MNEDDILVKKKINPQIVAAAIIEKDGRILIGKRKRGKKHSGNWELPGGTLEEGETCEQCLKREILEEFSVAAEAGNFFCSSIYSYAPDWTIELLTYKAKLISGELKLNDHTEVRWVRPADLCNYLHGQADRPIMEKLVSECVDKHS